MAVISLTIIESSFQKVAGIPVSVSLSTNVPATIFYTLDGSNPTTSSSVATGTITLPEGQDTVIFKAFATDGVDSSPIITKEYGTTTVFNRHPRDRVTGLNDVTLGATFPFGSQDPGGPGIYGNAAGLVVDSPDIAGIGDGYDGTATGTYSNETDVPLTELDLIYSETNRLGERGAGIGTLTAEATAVIPKPIQEMSVPEGSSDMNSPFFNPKALVVFQDSREDPYDPDVPKVNRPYFNLSNPERTRNGSLLFTSAEEAPSPLGALLKQQYNPKDGTITYYYRDQDTGRWIISKTAFTPRTPNIANYSKIVFGRDKPTAKVFKWIPFKYRTLW